MTPSRNAIYNALFNVLQGTPGIAAFGRKYVPWTQVRSQPYLILREYGETYEWPLGRRGPAKPTLISNLILYSRADDPNISGAIALNDLIDAIENQLIPQLKVGIPQTLGGQVHWARFQGRQTIYEGDNQAQAITVIELHVLALGALSI